MLGLGGVPGSLTLGGFDQTRFEPNDICFTFNADDSRSLTLAVQEITATHTLHGDIKPLTAGILSLVDSTVPHIWLPTSACKIFEDAFGLIYDNATDLYVLNDTTHARLQQLNPVVSFKLGNSLTSSETVTINLPYGAFDLQASHPIYTNATNYFPLRRASNDSQYTLGRTFLQEAYVTVNYERMNFFVSQAVFQNDNKSHIVSISPVTNRTTTVNAQNETSPRGLNTAQIVIIVISVLAFVVLMAIIALLFLYRKRKKRIEKGRRELPAGKSDKQIMPPAPTSPSTKDFYKRDLSNASTVFTELPAYTREHQFQPATRQSKPQELLGSPCAAELESPYEHTRSYTMDEVLRTQYLQENRRQESGVNT